MVDESEMYPFVWTRREVYSYTNPYIVTPGGTDYVVGLDDVMGTDN
jgi:hypothetical protein